MGVAARRLSITIGAAARKLSITIGVAAVHEPLPNTDHHDVVIVHENYLEVCPPVKGEGGESIGWSKETEQQ